MERYTREYKGFKINPAKDCESRNKWIVTNPDGYEWNTNFYTIKSAKNAIDIVLEAKTF